MTVASAQADVDFSGRWKLNPARSELRSMPVAADALLRVEQKGASLQVFAGSADSLPATPVVYPLDRRSEKTQSGAVTTNSMSKWEGSALLVNTLVSGPRTYTVMERWTRSRDGNTLTIERTVVQAGRETESKLVYERPDAPQIAAAPAPSPARSEVALVTRDKPGDRIGAEPKAEEGDFIVEQGTRILCKLTSAVNTKTAAAGDRVYMQTAIPVFVNGRVVIPRGSYVVGTVTETQRAGRVKGRSNLTIRFDSVTLPNGVSRSMNSRPSAADAKGNLERKEGKIEGEDNKGGDARTVGQTTAAGAGIGTVAGAAAGHLGMGAGIGAAAGAAAGLGRVLSTRGPDVMLRPGDTMELTLDRDLTFASTDLLR